MRDVKNELYSMCLVGAGVELELEYTSQPFDRNKSHSTSPRAPEKSLK